MMTQIRWPSAAGFQTLIIKFTDLPTRLKDTADMISRVSDNLEVTFDQFSDDLEDNISSLADKVEKRVSKPGNELNW